MSATSHLRPASTGHRRSGATAHHRRGATAHLRCGATALAVSVALVAGACSHASSDPPSARVTVPRPPRRVIAPPATLVPGGTPEDEEIARAYVHAMDVITLNHVDPNPDDPRLAETRMGRALKFGRENTADARDQHIVLRFRHGRRPWSTILGVQHLGADAAVVMSCRLDDSIQIQMPARRVISDTADSRTYRSLMQRTQGQWRLADQDLVSEWPGLNGCSK